MRVYSTEGLFDVIVREGEATWELGRVTLNSPVRWYGMSAYSSSLILALRDSSSPNTLRTIPRISAGASVRSKQ